MKFEAFVPQQLLLPSSNSFMRVVDVFVGSASQVFFVVFLESETGNFIWFVFAVPSFGDVLVVSLLFQDITACRPG